MLGIRALTIGSGISHASPCHWILLAHTMSNKAYIHCDSICSCVTKLGRKKRLEGRILHVRLPEGIVSKIDELAGRDGLTRSDWVRNLLVMYTAVPKPGERITSSFQETIEPIRPELEEALTEVLKRMQDGKETILDRLLKNVNKALSATVEDWTKLEAKGYVKRPKPSNSKQKGPRNQ